MGGRGTECAALGALVSFIFLVLQAGRVASQLTEVRSLSAEPDFRQVSLHWLYPRRAPDLFAFRVDYCELQAWGVNRCRTKVVDAPPRPPVAFGRVRLPEEDLSEYGAVVTGLRMATNYTFSVAPLEGRLGQLGQLGHPARNRHSRTIMAPTKGFSARATLCLPDVSEVEVHTGPHFSGRIAVEASELDAPPSASAWRLSPDEAGDRSARGLSGPGTRPVDEPCAVAGDAASPRESYTLRIDHRRCGSHVNRSTVATFILVQENLPILTHSTRRFLVLCTFQPDALIVRAGISLPTVHGGHGHREELAEPAQGNQLGGPAEVMAFQLQQDEEDADDALRAPPSARQQRRHAARALGLGLGPGGDGLYGGGGAGGDEGAARETREAQLVLTSVLLVSGVVLCAVAAWWFAPRRKRSRTHPGDDGLADDSASVYQNYENSLRDSDSCSSLSTVGTVNSSILSSLSRHQWAAAVADLRDDAKALEKARATEEDFGEVRPSGLKDDADAPSSLVFTVRLPESAGVAPVRARLTAPVVVPGGDKKLLQFPVPSDGSSGCSVSIGELESLSSHSDA